MNVLNDLNFTTETANGNFVVDFYADWCGPCKMMTPILEELNSEMEDVEFVKVDTSESTVTPTKFGIRSIPTLVFIKNGVEIERLVGAMPKPALKDVVEKVFS